jgi:hypothetical protein
MLHTKLDARPVLKCFARLYQRFHKPSSQTSQSNSTITPQMSHKAKLSRVRPVFSSLSLDLGPRSFALALAASERKDHARLKIVNNVNPQIQTSESVQWSSK